MNKNPGLFNNKTATNALEMGKGKSTIKCMYIVDSNKHVYKKDATYKPIADRATMKYIIQLCQYFKCAIEC